MHLQGKSEFERQIKNEHKDSSTGRKYYENDINFLEDKYIKLGDILNNIMENIFTGKVLRKESDSFTIGVISDCSNNLNPNYIGFSKLKKRHICSDWKKCLTKCHSSVVIPNIHGPAIMAWRDYLLELEKELPFQNFAKEGFSYDLTAVEEVLTFFSESEIAYSNKNKNKYYNLVRTEFPISYETGVNI